MNDLKRALDRRADEIERGSATTLWNRVPAQRVRVRRRRRQVVLAACVGTTIAAVATGATVVRLGNDTAVPAATSEATISTGPALVALEDQDSYPAAALTGRLEQLDGCLVFEGKPVLFPSGTTWESSAPAVVLPSGTRLAVGQAAQLSGGLIDGPAFSSTYLDKETATRVEQCQKAAGGSTLVLVSPSS